MFYLNLENNALKFDTRTTKITVIDLLVGVLLMDQI